MAAGGESAAILSFVKLTIDKKGKRNKSNLIKIILIKIIKLNLLKN